MANHSLPLTTSTYVNFVAELDGRLDDLAIGLDPAITTVTNMPTNTIRWTSAANRWEKYNGTAWVQASAAYSININGTVGATAPATGAFTTLSSNSTTALATGTTVGGNPVVTTTDNQVLTNKTLTSPVISTISNTGLLTLPTTADTIVGRATTDTLTNKTLTAPRFADLGFIADSTGNELVIFDSNATAVNEVTVANAATTGKPTISATGGDVNITLNLVSKGTGTVQANAVDVVTVSGSQILTNKTLTTPIISSISNTGLLTLPTSADTLVGRATTDTLTNKTLSTASTWNGNTIGTAYGGTGTAVAPVQGGAIYASTTSAYASTAAGTAYQFLQSNGTSAPTWSSFDLSLHAPDSAYKKIVRLATVTDLTASTFAADVLSGYSNTFALSVTTALSTTATTTSTAGIKVGAVISGNANIPAATTVVSIVNATTFTMSAAATVVGTVSTTFTQVISALSIDGLAVVLNDRILVKNQEFLGGLQAVDTAKYNGIYYVSAIGSTVAPWTLTRAVDANTATDIDSSIVNVSVGTVNGGKTFKTYFTGTSTLNTSPMYWNRLVDASSSSLIGTPVTALGIDIATDTKTQTLVAGAVADLAINSLGVTTVKATSASTYTTGSTLYIQGPPVASTNATITTPYSIYAAAGNSYLGGNLGLAGDLSVVGGDITTGAAVASNLFNTTTTANIGVGTGLTTGTFTVGAAGSTGAVSLFPATGIQNITIGGATTGTLTLGGTTATAVQLPTGKTKIGTSTLVQGGAVSITLPTVAGTLVGSGDTGTVSNTMLAGSIADTKLLQITTAAKVSTSAITGTLAATNGGTGQSTYAVGDLLVGAATNTTAKLADVATGNVLLSGGVGVSPAYGKVDLTTHISNTLGVANGGTGATTSATAPFALKGTNTDITSLSGLTSVAGTAGGMPITNVSSINGGQLAGMRNRIINGGMQVQQRTASALVANNLVYGAADRTFIFVAATTVTGGSASVDNATSIGSTGSSVVANALSGTGVTAVQFGQRIEALNSKTLNGKTITLSAWVWHNTGSTINVNFALSKPTTTADTFSAQTTLFTQTGQAVPTATTTKITYTVTLGASDATLGLQAVLTYVTSGTLSAISFYLSDFQLEVGSVATPFEQRPYGMELALCQRYYRQSSTAAYGEGAIYGYASGTGGVTGMGIALPVTMRVSPTVNYGGTWSLNNCTHGASSNADSVLLFITGLAAGQMSAFANSSGFITYTAEL